MTEDAIPAKTVSESPSAKATHFGRLTLALTVIFAGPLDGVVCLLAIALLERQKKAGLNMPYLALASAAGEASRSGSLVDAMRRLFQQCLTEINQEALKKHAGNGRALKQLPDVVKAYLTPFRTAAMLRPNCVGQDCELATVAGLVPGGLGFEGTADRKNPRRPDFSCPLLPRGANASVDRRAAERLDQRRVPTKGPQNLEKRLECPTLHQGADPLPNRVPGAELGRKGAPTDVVHDEIAPPLAADDLPTNRFVWHQLAGRRNVESAGTP